MSIDLNNWTKLPKHHYYKNNEWRKCFIREDRIYEFYISVENNMYTLVCNTLLLNNVYIAEIAEYLTSNGFEPLK